MKKSKKIILFTIFFVGALPGLSVADLHTAPETALETALETAFQKEFAFLDQQRKALEGQTADFLRSIKREEATLQKKLDRLKNKLVSLDVEVDNKQAILEESSRSLQSKREDQARLDQLFEQANASLDKKVKGEAVRELYQSAIFQLNGNSEITRSSGEYFLPDGEKVTGEIINIGRIASYAIGESGSGMLIPAGNGKMKLWQPENNKTALALAAADTLLNINGLDVFLYEDKNQAIEESVQKSVMDIINSGGIIAWIIVITGGIAVVMVFLRAFFLKRANKGTDKLMSKIKDDVAAGNVKEAIIACEKRRGAAARVVTSTLRNLDRERDHLEDVVAESILHENTYLNRYGAAILVVAAVAPLMGLLGTVTGMIETFDIITQFGTGDPKLLSVGISTALVTTQLGLIVAIPALVAGNLLSGWSNKIKDNMEQAALSVINLHGMQKIKAANDVRHNNIVAA